tara:strand:- start:1109 stop:1825 length:717 start_codon:yes stop_codon:yes gene_type:complete
MIFLMENNLYINGCSYTAGNYLEEQETWPFKLSKLSNTTLYNCAINGQSMGSIYLNSISHLRELDSKNTSVVIGGTWPGRDYFTYKGFNINLTPVDFEEVNLRSKVSRLRRLNSHKHIDINSDEFNYEAHIIRRKDLDKKILPIYLAKREYLKQLILHNPEYKEDAFTKDLNYLIGLQSFLENNKFNYHIMLFGSNNKFLNYINKDKVIHFNITENPTGHPTADDCTLISKMLHETIF